MDVASAVLFMHHHDPRLSPGVLCSRSVHLYRNHMDDRQIRSGFHRHKRFIMLAKVKFGILELLSDIRRRSIQARKKELLGKLFEPSPFSVMRRSSVANLSRTRSGAFSPRSRRGLIKCAKVAKRFPSLLSLVRFL